MTVCLGKWSIYWFLKSWSTYKYGKCSTSTLVYQGKSPFSLVKSSSFSQDFPRKKGDLPIKHGDFPHLLVSRGYPRWPEAGGSPRFPRSRARCWCPTAWRDVQDWHIDRSLESWLTSEIIPKCRYIHRCMIYIYTIYIYNYSYMYTYIYIYIYIYMWVNMVNYNDLTSRPRRKWWLVRGIIPIWCYFMLFQVGELLYPNRYD